MIMSIDPSLQRWCQEPALQQRTTWILVLLLLASHAGMAGWSATQHSPTLNEPAHLVAGLVHWRFGRFDVYCVTPPLVHYVAALPVAIAGYHADWTHFGDAPGSRHEFVMGTDFLSANRDRYQWLITLGRWACIPISLCGALLCFQWSRELWGSRLAGLIALSQWCLDPNILAHAELITPDCAATTFGLGAGYCFWRYLRHPDYTRATVAGIAMGLAVLAKMSWIMLFVMWPLLWWLLGQRCRAVDTTAPGPGNPPRYSPWCRPLREVLQITLIGSLALYVLNVGYGFDGTFTRLKDFVFVSHALTGLEPSGTPGNRFQHSSLGSLPIPLPRHFVRGMDLQKKDFESYGQPSFLRGQWSDEGWWYYYIYGLGVKTTHSTQLLFVLACLAVWRRLRAGVETDRRAPSRKYSAVVNSEIVLWAPPIALLVLVSSQTEFNHHVRYVLPVLGFAFVFIGINSEWFALPAAPVDASKPALTESQEPSGPA